MLLECSGDLLASGSEVGRVLAAQHGWGAPPVIISPCGAARGSVALRRARRRPAKTGMWAGLLLHLHRNRLSPLSVPHTLLHLSDYSHTSSSFPCGCLCSLSGLRGWWGRWSRLHHDHVILQLYTLQNLLNFEPSQPGPQLVMWECAPCRWSRLRG